MGAGNSSGQGSPGHKSQLMHDTKDQASVWREFGGLGHRREAPRCSPRRPARGDAEGSMSAPKALSPPWTAGVEGRPLTTHPRRCPEPFPGEGGTVLAPKEVPRALPLNGPAVRSPEGESPLRAADASAAPGDTAPSNWGAGLPFPSSQRVECIMHAAPVGGTVSVLAHPLPFLKQKIMMPWQNPQRKPPRGAS